MPRLVFATLALAVCGCAAPVTPDVVITNARVFTNDSARPWAEAVASKGERLVANGVAWAMSHSFPRENRVAETVGGPQSRR